MRVVSPLGPLWRGLAASPDVTPTEEAGIEYFPARLAIGAPPLPADGTPQGVSPQPGWQVMLQRRVEPDVDGDGFGDETQDKCAGSPGVKAGCPRKKKCKRRKAKRRSDEAAGAKKKRCKKRKRKRLGRDA